MDRVLFIDGVLVLNEINDNPTKEFKLECGLRQGDPLPPLLFLIVGDAFSIMLCNTTNFGLFMLFRLGTEISKSLIFNTKMI
ncbi:hypothetical protein ACS0TY_032279 [Phlomoides rotata]